MNTKLFMYDSFHHVFKSLFFILNEDYCIIVFLELFQSTQELFLYLQT